MISRAGSSKSQQKLIDDNLEFAKMLARKLVVRLPPSIEVNDLTQEAVIGLIDAASRFDNKRGAQFQSFADRRIRGQMTDALRRNTWPRGIRKIRRNLEKARNCYHEQHGVAPTVEELAEFMNENPVKLRKTVLRLHIVELTSPYGDEKPVETWFLPAALAPRETPSPIDEMVEAEVRARVRAAIRNLPPREIRVIQMYYFEERPLKDIGSVLGVKESRASQLHQSAIRHLREALAGDEPMVKVIKIPDQPVAEWLKRTASPSGYKLLPCG